MSEDVTEHYGFGGSNATQWSVCYGYYNLRKTMPIEIAGPKAVEGSAIHKATELYCLVQIKRRTTGENLEVSYDMDLPPKGPAIAKDYWDTIWKESLEEFITGKQIYLERKMKYPGEEDAGGSPDTVVLYYNDKGELCATIDDLKTGDIVVDISTEQLKFYATCLLLLCQEKGKELAQVKVGIYQPVAEPPYSSHVYKRAELLRFDKKYRKAMAEGRKPGAKFTVGSNCDYCPCKAKCVAHDKHIAKSLDVTVKDKAFVPPEQLSDEHVLTVFSVLPELAKYATAVKKYVALRMINGNPIPGTKMIEGSGRRGWIEDVNTVVETLAEHDVTGVTKQSLIGLGQVETMLKATGLKKKDVDVILYPLIKKSTPVPKVVLESDPRPAIDIGSSVELLAGLDEIE